MGLTNFDARVRYQINRFIVDEGFAPTVEQLAGILDHSTLDIEQSFDRLANNHGLVLHPNSHQIWVAHPFSTAPTGFWVTTPSGSWWGNCALCSLGIAAMLKEDAVIQARLAGEGNPVELQVKNGNVENIDLLLNFCLPASKWWDNVLYTCSTVQYFRGMDDIEDWSERHNIPRGEAMTAQKAWELAKVWYGSYLDPQWRKMTADEAHATFAELGLTSNFWRLDVTELKDGQAT